MSLPEPIFQDHLINDFPAGNGSPSEEIVFSRVKFFISHRAATLTTLHPPTQETTALAVGDA